MIMIDKSWCSNRNERVLDKKKKTIDGSSIQGWFCSGGFGFGGFTKL
jgi:hypothetical protein